MERLSSLSEIGLSLLFLAPTSKKLFPSQVPWIHVFLVGPKWMKKRARVDFKSSCSAYPPTYYSDSVGHKNIRTAYSLIKSPTKLFKKMKVPSLIKNSNPSPSLLWLISSVYLNTRQAQERIFNQNRALALFSLNCLSFIDIDEGEYLSSSFQHLRLTSSSARYSCFMNFIRDYLLTYLNKVNFWLTKEVYWRNWPKHSSRSQIQMPRKRFYSLLIWDKWKNCFHFSFLFLSYLYIPPAYRSVFINQQHMHFVGTKKKVFQSTSATELLNRKKKERAHNHCLWTDLLNWRRTHSY